MIKHIDDTNSIVYYYVMPTVNVSELGGEMMTKRTRLIEERNRMGKTQQQVAADLGVSEVYIRKLESGVSSPGRDMMIRLQRYYKSPLKKLFPDLFCG